MSLEHWHFVLLVATGVTLANTLYHALSLVLQGACWLLRRLLIRRDQLARPVFSFRCRKAKEGGT